MGHDALALRVPLGADQGAIRWLPGHGSRLGAQLPDGQGPAAGEDQEARAIRAPAQVDDQAGGKGGDDSLACGIEYHDLPRLVGQGDPAALGRPGGVQQLAPFTLEDALRRARGRIPDPRRPLVVKGQRPPVRRQPCPLQRQIGIERVRRLLPAGVLEGAVERRQRLAQAGLQPRR